MSDSYLNIAEASEQYFESTPVKDWSYLGYLEVMQPYFNDSKLKSLKSVWKRRFNKQLKGIIKNMDEERSGAALNLINQKNSEVVEFWDLFEKRRSIRRQQKRQSDNYLERGKSKSIKTSIEQLDEQKDDNEAGPSSGKCSQNEESKWCLSSKRNVEDVLYTYATKLKIEKLVHSFIIDTTDGNIKNLFSEAEWKEIMNVNKKTVLAIDKDIGTHLMSYKNKTPSEMRAHIMKLWLNTTYNIENHFDFQYIHMYAVNIWGILIDKAFLNVPDIDLVRGEMCSVTSSNQRNDDEMYM
ncbi:102_t:CDS:2, partial [Funneliformis geosporum]